MDGGYRVADIEHTRTNHAAYADEYLGRRRSGHYPVLLTVIGSTAEERYPRPSIIARQLDLHVTANVGRSPLQGAALPDLPVLAAVRNLYRKRYC